MAKPTANINVLTDTFQNQYDKVNELATALNSIVVTANTTLANTTGNSHINGIFSANTLSVITGLQGGTIAANSSSLPQISSANLAITSNVVFSSTSNTWFLGGYLNVNSNTSFANVVTFSANVLFSGTTFSVNTANFNISSNAAFNQNLSFGANASITVPATVPISANGTPGSNGYILTSTGNSVYWGQNTSAIASKRYYAKLVSDVSLIYQTPTTVFSLAVVKDLAPSIIEIDTDLRFSGSEDLVGTIQLFRGSTVVDSIPIVMRGVNSSYGTVLSFSYVDQSSLAANSYTYSVKFTSNDTAAPGSTLSCIAGSNMKYREIKS